MNSSLITGLIIGAFVGSLITVIWMSLCIIAKESDEEIIRIELTDRGDWDDE